MSGTEAVGFFADLDKTAERLSPATTETDEQKSSQKQSQPMTLSVHPCLAK